MADTLLVDAQGKPVLEELTPAERAVQANTCQTCGARNQFQQVNGFGGLDTRYCLKCGAEAKEN